MSTTTDTATEAEKLAASIRAAEAKAAQATEADRARLAQLRKQQAEEQAAEKARQDRRAKAWAHTYLSEQHGPEQAAANKAERTARSAVADVLAEQPWVQALIDWQAAKDEQYATGARYRHARRLLGQSAQDLGMRPEVLTMREGTVHLDTLAAILHRVILDAHDPDPLGQVHALIAADDDTHPLAEPPAPKQSADPLAWLRRDGARVETNATDDEDGRTIYVHTSADRPGEWVHTDTAGKVVATSTHNRHPNESAKIDGSVFGSQLDEESGKFTKVKMK